MKMHQLKPDGPDRATYCGAPGVNVTNHAPFVTCADCFIARMAEVHAEKRPLGLYAVFYDGETRPVAGFVLEQDAERYAREHAGDATWEIRHVQVVEESAVRSLKGGEG